MKLWKEFQSAKARAAWARVQDLSPDARIQEAYDLYEAQAALLSPEALRRDADLRILLRRDLARGFIRRPG